MIPLNPSRIKDATILLNTSFEWDKTEQGYEYWEAVYNNLKRLEKEGYPKKKHNKTIETPSKGSI